VEVIMAKTASVTEHSFAQYIRILGKGRHGARSLTRDEAYAAMDMICQYDVEPEQISAFMMLLRVKEETPEEVAGFVEALRASISLPPVLPEVNIDWSSYAGKRKQLPWYLLAALALSRNGVRIFMHGIHRNDDRLYTREALHALDMDMCKSLTDACVRLDKTGFAYLELDRMSRIAAEFFDMRDLLGLRPPIHTVVRMLNPLAAPVMLQGVFHPNYATIHQHAAKLLNQPEALVIKGEGGEIERVPERACTLYGLSDGRTWEEQWPALLPPDKYAPEHFPDLRHFRRVWDGETQDAYGEHAVTGTMALALRAIGKAKQADEAHAMAAEMWLARGRR
jgi:anthranilate phosphoribosyltransferase